MTICVERCAGSGLSPEKRVEGLPEQAERQQRLHLIPTADTRRKS
jgi:hypothetical protein